MKTLTFTSLADFKRKAQTGLYIKGGYHGNYANEWRKIGKVQTNGIALFDKNNKRSFFDFPKASDIKIIGNSLQIWQKRVKIADVTDTPVDTSFFQFQLVNNVYKPSELKYYEIKIADYQLGIEE